MHVRPVTTYVSHCIPMENTVGSLFFYVYYIRNWHATFFRFIAPDKFRSKNLLFFFQCISRTALCLPLAFVGRYCFYLFVLWVWFPMYFGNLRTVVPRFCNKTFFLFRYTSLVKIEICWKVYTTFVSFNISILGYLAEIKSYGNLNFQKWL